LAPALLFIELKGFVFIKYASRMILLTALIAGSEIYLLNRRNHFVTVLWFYPPVGRNMYCRPHNAYLHKGIYNREDVYRRENRELCADSFSADISFFVELWKYRPFSGRQYGCFQERMEKPAVHFTRPLRYIL